MEAAFFPLAIGLFLIYRVAFKRVIFYKSRGGYKELRTHIKWYHFAIYYAMMTFFAIGLFIIPFCQEEVRQVINFYELLHGKTFVSVKDKESGELNKGLPYGEEIVKYEVLSSTKPKELFDTVFPATIEYQHYWKQLWWVDAGVYHSVQYDFDKEFTIGYDSESKNYYILADGKKFADMEVKRTLFFKIIYAHYYWETLSTE
ncbi:MAG: hypothetical protein NC094_07285 [Bacteroidales bacterium]|nr:hypothetical protein [Lachnoclostridium sp.]MCM1384426.1 hypothetical protein [Lachnoclostridium sp.]MCM1465206.1 hypothetical protein [Bacteroidales bacterium]